MCLDLPAFGSMGQGKGAAASPKHAMWAFHRIAVAVEMPFVETALPGVQSTAYVLLVQLPHDSCMGSRETSQGAEGFPGEDPPPGGLRGGLRQAP